MTDPDKVVEEIKVVEEVTPEGKKTTTTTRKLGNTGGELFYSLGISLAVVMSYVKWKSVGWAVLHGVLGWFYVIYYVIKY